MKILSENEESEHGSDMKVERDSQYISADSFYKDKSINDDESEVPARVYSMHSGKTLEDAKQSEMGK